MNGSRVRHQATAARGNAADRAVRKPRPAEARHAMSTRRSDVRIGSTRCRAPPASAEVRDLLDRASAAKAGIVTAPRGSAARDGMRIVESCCGLNAGPQPSRQCFADARHA